MTKLLNLCFGVKKIYANRYRFDVLILAIYYIVTNFVHCVCRPALSPANIRGYAICFCHDLGRSSDFSSSDHMFLGTQKL